MRVLEAVAEALADAGEPLHYRVLTRRIIDRKLWEPAGAKPENTVNASISSDISRLGNGSRFERPSRGMIALRSSTALGNEREAVMGVRNDRKEGKRSSTKVLSFTNAAERVLRERSSGQPVHYRDITQKALDEHLINSAAQTPALTMYAQIHMEIQRRKRRGDAPRFVMHKGGMISLASWTKVPGLTAQIEEHNKEVRRKLLTRLQNMRPEHFEELVGELLGELGFEEVSVTKRTRDGGIDVRGTLVVGDVVRTQMAVQAKRQAAKVGPPIVQQLRGTVGPHEQGLIITTGDFTRGGRNEASRSDVQPVGLVNGDQLAALLVEHELGVRRTAHDLLDLIGSQESEREEDGRA